MPMMNDNFTSSLPFNGTINLQDVNIFLRENSQDNQLDRFLSWQMFAIIHHHRLWAQGGYDSCATYCFEVWGYQKSHAYDLVKAGEAIASLLSTKLDVPYPASIKQAVALARIPEPQRIDAWRGCQQNKIPLESIV
jgi:hypothetical protein